MEVITDGLIIDGTTDADFSGNPVIEINGFSSGGADGLHLNGSASDGSTIRGLIINQFDEGIVLYDSDNNLVAGNWIGVDSSGTADQGNTGYGIEISLSSGNTVGGTTAVDRNIISGNDQSGISLWTDTTATTIQGNYIGLNAAGTSDVGNTRDGIAIGNGANANLIGGDRTLGQGNVISGNLNDGIEIGGDTTDNNLVYGNLIGTDYTGTVDVGNVRHGVVLYNQVVGNQVGGILTGQGNVISGNNDDGVVIDGNGNVTTTSNVIAGNFIGTDVTGLVDLGNTGLGIDLFGAASGNTIGGTTSAHRNVISGNNSHGIEVSGATTTGNKIEGNYIGTDSTGMAGLRNEGNGIRLDTNSSTTIGGTILGAGNVISGNDNSGTSADGIYITGGGSHTIQGNTIGLAQDGVTVLGNDSSGIAIYSSTNNLIGGTDPNATNVISGNTYGVNISGVSSTGNNVQNNYVGTDSGGTLDRGNSSVGVWLNGGANNNTIGGTVAGAGNVISGNDLDGIQIQSATTSWNTVVGNYIGTDYTGTADVGNTSRGISVTGDNNTIGSIGWGNVISGNNADGIQLTNVNGTTIQSNRIGTNAAGTAALANSGRGVNLNVSATNTIIGGSVAGEGNLVSGNASDGIRVGANSNNANITGNTVGTDITGSVDLGNTLTGINVIGGVGIVIHDNLVSGNNVNGITIGASASGTTVTGNLIGTDVTGMFDLGNSQRGVSIVSSGNTIGGAATLDRNVISGNDIQGIMLNGSGATGNTVEGNYIGTNILGSGPVANTGAGIFLGNSADNNTIGGTTAGQRNVISGNSGDGIQTSNTTGLIVTGNYIGTNSAGTAALANGADGISLLYNVDSAVIGGATANHRNVISGNTSDGVSVIDATSLGNLIQGNYIGTDYTGMVDLGNTAAGILINGATSTTIDTNLISGNNAYGIYVGNVVSNGSVITGNMIGLDAAGGQMLNSLAGIVMLNATSTTIGGVGAGEGNVINSTTAQWGILAANTTDMTIQGNLIGTDSTGTSQRDGGDYGIYLFNSVNAQVGGIEAGGGNVIGGYTTYGIMVAGAPSAGIVIEGNFVGTDVTGTSDLTDGQYGIAIDNSATGVTIGGILAGAGNTIANNSVNGVRLTATAGTGNAVRGNRIYDNTGIGIDAGVVGATANDDESDGIQNYPVLNSALYNDDLSPLPGR